MSLIAIAKEEKNHNLFLEHLKETITLSSDGQVIVFLRLMIKVEQVSAPFSAFKILFADKVDFLKDKTELLVDKDYLSFLKERESKVIDNNKAMLDGYEFEIVKVVSCQCRQESYIKGQKNITEMKLFFGKPLVAGNLYASLFLLKILERNVKLNWRESEKMFITECRFHKFAETEGIRGLLNHYDDSQNRIFIKKHELWIDIEGNFNIEAHPQYIDRYTHVTKESIPSKFDLPSISKGTAIKYVFEAKNNEWLNEVIPKLSDCY